MPWASKAGSSCGLGQEYVLLCPLGDQYRGITQEREGAKAPTEPWRRNDKEKEKFSKDILRENRKLESDPRED